MSPAESKSQPGHFSGSRSNPPNRTPKTRSSCETFRGTAADQLLQRIVSVHIYADGRRRSSLDMLLRPSSSQAAMIARVCVY